MTISIYIRGNKIDIASKIESAYNENDIMIDFFVSYIGMCIGAILTGLALHQMIN